MKNQDIKFGQVWKAVKDYKITMYSTHTNCVIPKGARVVVLNTPMPEAIGFSIMPLTSKNIDKKLVPNLKQMELHKEGFGVVVNTEYFKKRFVLDDDQKIEFNSGDSAEFWEKIITTQNKI
jgi:hypothetical protein